MWQLNLLLFTQMILGIVIVVLIQKISKMRSQVDEITKEVKDYISFIIEDEEPKTKAEEIKKTDTINGDEIHSSLIQAVLGDIFP